MQYFFCVLGLVFVLEGLPYFAFPDKMKNIMIKISETPEKHLRLLGLASIIAGIGLVYFGTR
jgi:uncharacterized protein YjeT (DUF2065 family)